VLRDKKTFILYTLWFCEELEIFIRQVFELNAIRFSIHKVVCDEIFFKDQEGVFGFCFNQLVDGGVHKLFGVKAQGLTWGNDKWLDEGDVV
jgi:hypothetical protein